MLTKAEIARLRSLQEKKHREADGHFVVEGEKVITELLAAGFAFAALYAIESWSPPPTVTTLHRVSAEEMRRISHFPTPSPVLALGRIVRPRLESGELDSGLTLALDGVQDAGNVGTLLRIADWFGFARVLLSPECADVFSQKVINASMGSFARVRAIVASLPTALAEAGVPVIGCDLQGEPLEQLDPHSAAIVVIGSEGRGLSSEVKARLTRTVTIARWGQAESLNAAVAAGIVCHRVRGASARARKGIAL